MLDYKADVLADSIGEHGVRLSTLEITIPRPYLAELNTHRVFSRNSESSRAIPTEMRIQQVMDKPYIPEFRARAKGMGGGEFLEGLEYEEAKRVWLNARDAAVWSAKALLHISKDDANRLLEPFMWQTIIVSSTEWMNFLNLRDHEGAAIPMQRIAPLMRKAMEKSVPELVHVGEWHLPLVDTSDPIYRRFEIEAKVSAGRCARSSYSTHHDPESSDDSVKRWERLAGMGHWSPGEHPAMCLATATPCGNFVGWMQLRKTYPGEAVFQG